MPSIAVFVDGALMARVNSEGLDILTVNVGSTKADETLATIEFSGGKYPDDGDSSHLIWLNELQLSSGQTVRVLVSASGDTTAPGRTLEELYPDLPEEKEGPMPTRSQLIAEVSKRPHFREGYSFTLRSSSGAAVEAAMDPEEHGFSASFLWNWVRPERVSASLHTYSLAQLTAESGFNYHFQERLEPEAWVELRVDA